MSSEFVVEPGVAHTVHYVSHGTPVRADGTQAYTKQCRAAVITEVGGWVTEHIEELPARDDGRRRRVLTQVWDGDRVGLKVDNPTGLFFHSIADGGCKHDEGGDVADWSCSGWDYEGGTWHWPTG